MYDEARILRVFGCLTPAGQRGRLCELLVYSMTNGAILEKGKLRVTGGRKARELIRASPAAEGMNGDLFNISPSHHNGSSAVASSCDGHDQSPVTPHMSVGVLRC